MAVRFHAETEIGASAAEVWRHIDDLSSYGEWHALLPSVSGELEQGALLSIEVYGQSQPLRARILRLAPEQELTLAVQFPLGLLRPVYTQRLEPLGEGWVRYVQTEEFRGPLSWLLAGGLRKTVSPLYDLTCDALRRRVMVREKDAT